MEIIPAIDVMDGRCVRLSKGDYATQKVYNGNPVDMARRFEDNGFGRLHLVDLDGARQKHCVNLKTLEAIATHTALRIDFGGGMKTEGDLRSALSAGASLVTVGSLAATEPELMASWISTYGADTFILGADVRGEEIAVNGWTAGSGLSLYPFLERYTALGISHVLCTDIARDGMLQGSAVELYKNIMQAQPQLHLIASGGIGSLTDIDDLKAASIPAVVVGKAIYEGRIALSDLAKRQ